MSAPKDPQKYEEWKQKIAKSLQGHTPPNKGKPMSSEQKAKLSKVRKGRIPPNKGKPMSDEQKTKLSKANKGRKHTDEELSKMRGRKMSPESIAKKVASSTGKACPPVTRAKISASEKGKKVSEETRTKMSKIFTRKPNYKLRGYKHDDKFSAKVSERNRQSWNSKTEDERRAHLDKLHDAAKDITKSVPEEVIALRFDTQGVVYERQKRIGWYRVDFFLPDENRVIEVLGCYWHQCEQCGYSGEKAETQRSKDRKRCEYLIRKGYIVDYVWEHELTAETRRLREQRNHQPE